MNVTTTNTIIIASAIVVAVLAASAQLSMAYRDPSAALVAIAQAQAEVALESARLQAHREEVQQRIDSTSAVLTAVAECRARILEAENKATPGASVRAFAEQSCPLPYAE